MASKRILPAQATPPPITIASGLKKLTTPDKQTARCPAVSRQILIAWLFPLLAKELCGRRASVGADGLILIENSTTADFRWQFLNGDGSWAEMCGNGARCAARFAFALGIAPARMRFETVAGIIEAEVTGESVKLKMTAPNNLRLAEKIEVNGEEQVVHSLNTGVPHAVLFMEDIQQAPVMELGRALRFHEHFQPAGTNVNFVQKHGGNGLIVRTYLHIDL